MDITTKKTLELFRIPLHDDDSVYIGDAWIEERTMQILSTGRAGHFDGDYVESKQSHPDQLNLPMAIPLLRIN